ncbi:MAG: hypothetical protein FVQ82_14750 [Planctomycetes bacterium]|nr:hypothetical protein [Planctomycetota bacterium]
MANDGSIMVQIEKFIADRLAALEKTPGGAKVFNKAEPWNYQIDPKKGGIEAFVKYTPFAFVSFLPPDFTRAGDYDLDEKLVFCVALGVTSKEDGVARAGDATHYGIAKLYDLTVAAIDGVHPGVDDCSDLHLFDAALVSESIRSYCLQLYFESKLIRTSG